MTRTPVVTAPVSSEWRRHAACISQDPEKFDPAVGDVDTLAEARAICATCPVTEDCLRSALAEEGATPIHQRACIRGGYTPEERVSIYRGILRRRAQRAATNVQQGDTA